MSPELFSVNRFFFFISHLTPVSTKLRTLVIVFPVAQNGSFEVVFNDQSPVVSSIMIFILIFIGRGQSRLFHVEHNTFLQLFSRVDA